MNDPRAALRARMSSRRAELGAKQRIAAATGALRSLETLPAFLAERNIAGYWAVRGELPLHRVVASLRQRDQHYFLPVLGTHRRLRFAEYRDGSALVNNRVGIPEPAVAREELRGIHDIDVVLMPLLAFDRQGHRLGTGGGWYDMTLAFLRAARRPARPLLVGVGYAFQQAQAIAAEPWDVPLDYVATDQALLRCGDDGPSA